MVDRLPRSGGVFGRLRGLFRRVPVPVVPVAPREADGWRAFRLVPASGGWVAATADGALLGISAQEDAAAIAIVPNGARHVCFLVALAGGIVGVAADPTRAAAVSGRILPTDARGVIRLLYPVGRQRFLTASEGGGLRFDGSGDTMEAVFALVALEGALVPDAVRAAAGELGAACGGGMRAAPLLAALGSGALRPALAEPVLRLLPEEELAGLAQTVLAQPEALARLGGCMPEDRWVGEMLPALAAWQDARPALAGHVGQCSAADETALLPAANEGLVPAGLALHALARRQILPRRGACIVASARNEGPYLLDWLSYHLSIGFEHVFLYTNENADGSDAMLAALAAAGAITLVRNDGCDTIGPQLRAYTHALTMLPDVLDFRWAALLDVDEYVAFDTRVFDGIGDFLAVQESQRVDAIALCWVVFAALPDERWTDASTLQRFTRRSSQISPLVKSIIRPGKFWYSQPHFPTATLDAPFEYRDAGGGIHHHAYVDGRIPAMSAAPAAEQAWVAHYWLRSGEEALWKWARGRGDVVFGHPDRLRSLNEIASGFLDLARPELLVEDTRILACAGGQAAVLARLLALPGVAACDAAIKASFGKDVRANAAAFAVADTPGLSAAVGYFKESLVGSDVA